MRIRSMQPSDWPQVALIYQQGMATGFATFEHQLPTYDHWNSAHLLTCRWVAEKGTGLLGWAALSPVSSRSVYRGVAEVSIYMEKNARGKGFGSALLQHLVISSEAEGYWTLQSGIFPENQASIKLHEKLGFRYLGKRERVGKTTTGEWKDNLLFERRSKIVGI